MGAPPVGISVIKRYSRTRGDKQYELANYFGNVEATIRDRKTPIEANGVVTHYEAQQVNSSSYYPFGALMPNRGARTEAYRFGFSGLERDDELKGAGNSYYTNARLFDPRVGRWLGPDPIHWPESNPYVGFSNNPLRYSDPQGRSNKDVVGLSRPNVALQSVMTAADLKVEEKRGAIWTFGAAIIAIPQGLALDWQIAASTALQEHLAAGNTSEDAEAKLKYLEQQVDEAKSTYWGLAIAGTAQALSGAFAAAVTVEPALPVPASAAALETPEAELAVPASGAAVETTAAPALRPATQQPIGGKASGKLWYHYTTSDESSFGKGLWAQSSVTDKLYTNAEQASQELGIPVPNKVIPIRDTGQFVKQGNGIVQPSNRYPGGGTAFTNPKSVPAADLLKAQPIE
jgi:RHS repeat-associated protein